MSFLSVSSHIPKMAIAMTTKFSVAVNGIQEHIFSMLKKCLVLLNTLKINFKNFLNSKTLKEFLVMGVIYNVNIMLN